MLIERAVVASKNPDKIAEMREVLTVADPRIELVDGLDWPDVVEDAPTLEENAVLKARGACAATGVAAIADDTGLEVDALGGAPGVYTARFSGPDATYESNIDALIEAMEGVEERRAVFRTVIAVATPEGDELTVDGELVGTIARGRRGEGGFGYDPVFEVDGRTLAEIDTTEKNLISHRARALRALATRLVGVT